MKILYLCPDLGIPVLGRKGAAVHVREMVAAFQRGGHKVILAAQSLNKSPWEKAAEVDAQILHVKPSSSSGASVLALKEFNAVLGVENSLPGELRRILYNKELENELKRRLENDPPDFIYERASLYATAGVSLARQFKVPLLLELNAPLAIEQSTYRATGFGELAAQSEKWILSNADAVLAVSALLRDHIASLGIPQNRIHIFPNGVNSNVFSPAPPDEELRARLNLNNALVLGFVGGLRPWHGVQTLPALLEKMIVKFPNARLLMVGEGPLRSELEKDFRNRNLSDKVIFAGSVSHAEVAAMIRLFDVALAPYSNAEHDFYFSPLKLFEYMGCGIATVAANLGQIPEVIKNCETGLLYRAGNLDDLASVCTQLLENPPLRLRLGAAAAQEVRVNYTWDQNAIRAVELARSIANARK